jgi:hypothetical protein
MKKIGLAVSDIAFNDDKKLCKEWVESYTISQSIIYGISFGISALNFLLRFLIRKITRWEAHHSLTEYLSSTTTKLWVV